MMDIPVSIERRPGFFSSLGSPEALDHLPTFLEEQFARSGYVEAFDQYLVEPQGRITDQMKKLFIEFLEFYDPKPVPGTEEEHYIRVAVNELHCPHVTGAKAKLTVQGSREETINSSIKIFGIGGGDEFTVTIETGETMETEGNCVATTLSVPATFDRCRMNTPDGGHIEFARLKDINWNSKLIKGEVLDPDACTQFTLNNPTAEQVTFDFIHVPSLTLTPSLTVKAGTKWSNEATVTIEKLGLELGAKYESTLTDTITYDYTLIQGYSYTAMRPYDAAYWLWKWNS